MSERTVIPDAIDLYGLRIARGMIAKRLMTLGDEDPFLRGQREALKVLDNDIQQAIEDILARLPHGTIEFRIPTLVERNGGEG